MLMPHSWSKETLENSLGKQWRNELLLGGGHLLSLRVISTLGSVWVEEEIMESVN